MTYSLDEKIKKYLASHGVIGAEVHEGTISLPNGFSKTIDGVANKRKLDEIIVEYKSKNNDTP